MVIDRFILELMSVGFVNKEFYPGAKFGFNEYDESPRRARVSFRKKEIFCLRNKTSGTLTLRIVGFRRVRARIRLPNGGAIPS